MRITYYYFPDSMSVRDRVLATKQILEGKTDITEVPEDIEDEVLDRNFPIKVDITITMAKRMIKRYGGHAFTQHFDRNGGLFETTEVIIKGNNSIHKYNRHL